MRTCITELLNRFLFCNSKRDWTSIRGWSAVNASYYTKFFPIDDPLKSQIKVVVVMFISCNNIMALTLHSPMLILLVSFI